MDHERAVRARANFTEAGLGERALVLEQDAVKGLEKLEARFDVCFIDLLNSFPSEDVVRKVLELCLLHLDGGALLMADNALRQGEVVQPRSLQARNATFYNELVSRHPQLESVVVPIRDGLSIARVKD
jgi:predicted O-methyltransferase YrrM